MRTNIEIDDALMAQALASTGLATKRAVVEEGLRLLVSLKEQDRIRDLVGKITFEDDHDAAPRWRQAG